MTPVLWPKSSCLSCADNCNSIEPRCAWLHGSRLALTSLRFGADKGGDQELDPRILQALGDLYFEGEPGRRSAANLLTKDEAQHGGELRQAAGIAQAVKVEGAGLVVLRLFWRIFIWLDRMLNSCRLWSIAFISLSVGATSRHAKILAAWTVGVCIRVH
jgi:hypothetical protein